MDNLERDSIRGLLFKLILPSLVTALVSGSYNLVDGMFIGQSLGILGNSANTYTFIIYALVYSFSALVSEGAASLLSMTLGQKKVHQAKNLLANAISLSFLTAILQGLLIWLGLGGLLRIFGAPNDLLPYVKEFTLIFLLGSPIYFIAHTLLYCLRAQGELRRVLVINFWSFLVNTGMGYFLIMTCHMGFIGSALSTVLANGMTLALVGHFYYSKRSTLKPSLKMILSIDKRIWQKLLEMGLPFFLTSVVSVFLLVLYNRIAFAYAGTFGIAALSIVSSIYRYIISLMNAVTDGVQPVISFNFGAKNTKRVREGLKER